MFAAYLDESFDTGNKGVFAAGGLIHHGWGWLKAETLWSQLSAETNTNLFKASRIAASDRDLYMRFASVLQHSGIAGFGVVIPQETFRNTFALSKRDRLFRQSPYYLAYQHLFVDVAQKLLESEASELVSFVCDKTDRYAPTASEVFESVRKKNPNAAQRMGSFWMRKDSDCVPLQMADLIAFELRLAGRVHLGFSTERGPAYELLKKYVFWKGELYDQPALDAILNLENSDPDILART